MNLGSLQCLSLLIKNKLSDTINLSLDPLRNILNLVKMHIFYFIFCFILFFNIFIGV